MHLADGVLSTPVIIATYGASIVSLVKGAKGIEDEDIPKISLMSATFFAASLISIPVPPTSVHPLLCGLIGIILGKKSATTETSTCRGDSGKNQLLPFSQLYYYRPYCLSMVELLH